MKKHLLVFAFVGISGLLAAQSSFNIIDFNGSDVTGTTQTYWIDQDVQDAKHYTFNNNTTGNIDVKVRRTIIQLNTPTATTNFCTNVSCYPPNINMSILFTVNGTGGFFDLISDYFPDSTAGFGHVRYTVLNQNVPSDSTTFDIIYNSAPVGVNAPNFAKASVSNPAPNPASSVFVINYKLGSTTSVGAKMVVYNMLGDRVKEQTIEENDGTIRMDVSTFNQGIYICSLESEGKTLVTRRLVVTH
ncbi:MAG: T9SS type A sorting domain-containing protein [Bacteroidetes bacterium]|nr:T9SS type A sorting domain-containing protein [Bacteroidota bacterium]PHX82311.1 MAG: hypothetical protein CK539_05320 [Flavobacteriales bacterium]